MPDVCTVLEIYRFHFLSFYFGQMSVYRRSLRARKTFCTDDLLAKSARIPLLRTIFCTISLQLDTSVFYLNFDLVKYLALEP